MIRTISHMNTCGSNVPENAEMTSAALGSFGTAVADDIPQTKVGYRDPIQAARAGTFSWESAVALGYMVAGKSKVKGPTLFKSGGAALEDVAVASMLYDRATKSGGPSANVELD
jgi:ornithine cyclodeaminase/alanine dehydrogenase-like protein (mu-crystallin family)